MAPLKILLLNGSLPIFLWMSSAKALGISENIQGNSKTCSLTSEDLFEAATRADCVDGGSFSSCWVIGESGLRGLAVGSSVAIPVISKVGGKAAAKANAYDKAVDSRIGAGMNSGLLELEHNIDPAKLKASLKESADQYRRTMQSLGVPDLEIVSALGLDHQYVRLVKRSADLKELIGDYKTSSAQKAQLEQELRSLKKEIDKISQERMQNHRVLQERFHVGNRRYLLKSGAASVAAGAVTGTAFVLASEYFQTAKLAKCVSISESEANDLKGYVTNTGGLLGDCRVGVPSVVIQKIASLDEAGRSQFFSKRPKLCQLIQDQNKHFQTQQEEFAKQISYKVKDCRTQADGSLAIDYNLSLRGNSYEGTWSKHGDMSEVRSTLIPGTFAEVGANRSFSVGIDAKDGELRSFRTSHPKVGGDWNVSNAAGGDQVDPMKSYSHNYLAGECRFMNPDLERGNYHGNAKYEIGCSAARLTQAFKYISKGLVGQCAQQLKNSTTTQESDSRKTLPSTK
jgi:hypothetical protein